MASRTTRTAQVAGLLALLGLLAPAAQAAPADTTGPAPSPTASGSAAPASTPPGSDRPVYTGDVIVRFAPGSDPAISSAARDRALDRAGSATGDDLTATRTLAGGATLVAGGDPADATTIAARLRDRDDVAFAEPDRILRPAAAPNDEYWGMQWNLAASPVGIGVESAWTRTKGAGVTVAVVDSGIVPHPEFAGRLRPGYDFISDRTAARDGNGRDADPTDEGDWFAAGECGLVEGEDSSWHGTHVAGIVAAAEGNSVGVAGVAPAAYVEPVRALGKCGGTLADIADALTWASGGAVAGAPKNAHPARVVNLSIGGPGSCGPTMQHAVDGANARGSVVVVAAGNENADATKSAPGNCRGVLDVAATTKAGGRASYSDHGSVVALAAPGGGGVDDVIISTYDKGRTVRRGPTYEGLVGTSMAAPHVSGVAALVLALRPAMTSAQVRSLLVATATPFRASCSGCGAGVVSAARAVAAASATTPTHTPSPAPAARPAAPAVTGPTVPLQVPTGASARIAWPASSGAARYDLQVREVGVRPDGGRTYAAWRTAARAVTSRSALVSGAPGTVFQYRVQALAATGARSAWSGIGVVGVATDVTARTGRRTGTWRVVADRTAVGGAVLQASRGATATLPATYASGLSVVAGTTRTGGTADVYLDGRRVRTVSTKATAAAGAGGARVVGTIPARYGRHTLRIVVRSGVVRLDGLVVSR